MKPRDLKFGMHVVKTLLYLMNPTDYTSYRYLMNFKPFFNRVGSVLFRSGLYPFFYTSNPKPA